MGEPQIQISENIMQAEDGLDQYLTFMLANEEYGIDILRVQEIKGWSSVTSIPNMPDFILGVINLRGTVVPIVDLRKLFQLESMAFSKTTVVIVVRVRSNEKVERTMGIVVDAVSEVHNIAKANMKAAPDFGSACDTESINGLVTHDDRMIIILDIDHLMNDRILQVIENSELDA
ncbi:MAG: chemotaxis protein CheW [Gammaproteobacteria bacterium]